MSGDSEQDGNAVLTLKFVGLVFLGALAFILTLKWAYS